MGTNKAAVEGFAGVPLPMNLAPPSRSPATPSTAAHRAGGVGSLIALLTTYPLKTIYTLQAIRAVKARKGSVSREDALAILASPARLVASLVHEVDWDG